MRKAATNKCDKAFQCLMRGWRPALRREDDAPMRRDERRSSVLQRLGNGFHRFARYRRR